MKKLIWIIFLLCSIQSYGNKNGGDPDTTARNLFNLDIIELKDLTVSTVSKYDENIINSSSVISVIQKDEISKYGANNLYEVLERSVSFTGFSSAIFQQNTFGVRGDYPSHLNPHILFLINGNPIRETLRGSINATLLQSFPLESIQKIEIIRGPGSVLHGTNAFTAVINIITLSTEQNEETIISAQKGTFNSKKIAINKNISNKSISANMGINLNGSDGWELQANNTDSTSFYREMGIKALGTNLSIASKGFEFTNYAGIAQQQTISSFGYTPHNWNHAFVFNNLNYKKQITFGWDTKLSVTTNLSSEKFRNDSVVSVSVNNGDFITEWTNHINPIKNLDIVVGGLVNSLNGAREGKDAIYAVKPYNEVWYTGFLNGDYSPKKWIKISLGGQVNKVTDHKADFVPRLGIVLNKDLKYGVKLLYGEAYRTPTASEKEISIPFVLQGYQDLVPEKITTQEVQFFYEGVKFNARLTGFNSITEDLIGRINNDDPRYRSSYANVGRIQFRGVEFESRITPTPFIYFDINASTQTNYDLDSDDKNVSLLPNNALKIGAIYTNGDYLSLGIYNSFYSNSHTREDANIINPSPNGFNYLSAKLSVDLNHFIGLENIYGLETYIYGTNLLNQEIYYPDLFQSNINSMPGRASIAINFGLQFTF